MPPPQFLFMEILTGRVGGLCFLFSGASAYLLLVITRRGPVGWTRLPITETDQEARRSAQDIVKEQGGGLIEWGKGSRWKKQSSIYMII